MREVNFSIPNVNKASVGITTALYDRRALDCTSTLPLINSLHHLAYLTASSARIRDILTVDGGLERLVCILKEGRSRDMMSMWMWNLALQCVMNIGVRGTEQMRTRVVEADIVPVIATILDNFIQAWDKAKAKEVEERKAADIKERKEQKSFLERSGRPGSSSHSTSRRAPPPSISIPPNNTQGLTQLSTNLGAGLERLSRQPARGSENRVTFIRAAQENAGRSQAPMQPLTGPLPPVMDVGPETPGLRPVRDSDRLPSMLATFQSGLNSQPESPMTPRAPQNTQRVSRPINRQPARTRSMSGGSDSGNGEVLPGDTEGETETPGGNVSAEVEILRVDSQDNMLESVDAPMTLNGTGDATQDSEMFNIRQITRSPADGSIVNPSPNAAAMGFSPPNATVAQANAQRPFDTISNAAAFPATPRDEDVLMALQILAYVSKYCNLRSYFQKTHLVPALSITKELNALDNDGDTKLTEDEEEIEEYLLPDDYNVFPLVEKFTVRHHSGQMQYWAGVVMRNLCRKDESRNGIRQCAYYECGKWEDTPRQFAKCRRCRRTKYCSKECQKSAWAYHRHWCIAATP